MTQSAPAILLLIHSSAERAVYQQWLTANPDWHDVVLAARWQDIYPAAPAAGLSPDLLILDAGTYRDHKVQIQELWAASPPLLLVLLDEADEALAASVLAEGGHDYLVASELNGTRLRHSVQQLWRQRQLQEALRTCERQDIFGQMAVGINQADRSGRFVRVNQCFCDLLGYSEAELLQLSYQDVTHPQDLASQAEFEQQLFEGEKDRVTFEKRYLAKDGSSVWTRITLSVVRDEAGRPVSDLAVVEDISDRKQTEAALRQSQANLLEAQRLASLGSWEFDLVTQEVTWSQELLSTYGFDPAMRGPTFEQFSARVHPDDWPRLAEAIQTLMETGTPYSLHHRIIRPDGTVRHTFCMGQAVFDDHNRVVKTFGISQDITDAREAEIALQANEARYRQLAENMPNGAIQILDHDFNITFIGGQILAELGKSPAEIVGNHASGYVDEAAWQRIEPLLRWGLAGHTGRFEVRADGRDFMISFAPLYNLEGEVEGLQLISQDISDRKHIERALASSEAHLKGILNTAVASIMQLRVGSDYSLHYEYLSPGCQHIYGYTQQEFLNDTLLWHRLVVPEDMTAVIYPSFEQIFIGQPHHVEYRARHKDGGIRWIRAALNPQWDHGRQCWLVTVLNFDITEQKSTEHALRTSEAKQRAIINALPDLLMQANRAGFYLNFWPTDNFRVLQEHVDLVGTHIRETLPPPLAQRRLDAVEAALDSGKMQVYEQVIEFGDGSQIEEVRVVACNESEVIILVRDISAGKRAEAALLESEARFRQLAETVHEGFFVYEADTQRYSYVSPACERITGLDFSAKDSFADWLDQVQPPDRARIEAALYRELQGQNFDEEYRFLRADGEARWLRSQAFPITDAAGTLQRIVGTVEDISDRKQAEIQLREREASLQEFNRRWNSLLNNVQLIVIQLNRQGRIEYANPFFLHLTGYSAQEVLGHSWFERFLPQKRRGEMFGVFRASLRGDLLRQSQPDIILTKSGEELAIAWNKTLLHDTEGAPVGIISIGEDVTQRHQLELIKAEFISVVSHELKTPLTSVQAALSLLHGFAADLSTEDSQQVLAIANRGADRLAHIVNDILNLRRLESGQMQLEKRWFDGAEVMRLALEQVQGIADQAEITLRLSAQPVQAYGDYELVQQVLINLLGNAIKFSAAGTTISLTVTSQADSVLFAVQDQGRGIPRSQLSKIFESFYQIDTSDARQRGGSGMGLAICRNIVEEHGGRIWAESQMGRGSTFCFTLPHP